MCLSCDMRHVRPFENVHSGKKYYPRRKKKHDGKDFIKKT